MLYQPQQQFTGVRTIEWQGHINGYLPLINGSAKMPPLKIKSMHRKLVSQVAQTVIQQFKRVKECNTAKNRSTEKQCSFYLLHFSFFVQLCGSPQRTLDLAKVKLTRPVKLIVELKVKPMISVQALNRQVRLFTYPHKCIWLQSSHFLVGQTHGRAWSSREKGLHLCWLHHIGSFERWNCGSWHYLVFRPLSLLTCRISFQMLHSSPPRLARYGTPREIKFQTCYHPPARHRRSLLCSFTTGWVRQSSVKNFWAASDIYWQPLAGLGKMGHVHFTYSCSSMAQHVVQIMQ